MRLHFQRGSQNKTAAEAATAPFLALDSVEAQTFGELAPKAAQAPREHGKSTILKRIANAIKPA